MKKILLCGMVLFILILSACGGGGSGDDNNDNPSPIPTQTEVLDSTKQTLDPNSNIVNLNNDAQVVFSKEYAETNPEITVEKSRNADSKLFFDESKIALDIQEGTDFEIVILSSKQLTSEFDITLNIPENLIRGLNDGNAIAIYAEVPDDGEQGGGYVPLNSIYDEVTRKVSAKVTDLALNTQELKLKVALVKTYDEPGLDPVRDIASAFVAAEAVNATSLTGTLPPEGTPINQTFKGFLCPLAECIETSRFGNRIKEGKNAPHYGIDFRAKGNIDVKPIAEGKVIALILKLGGVLIETPEINKTKFRMKYLHFSKTLVEKDDPVNADTVLGKSGNTGTVNEHLHLEIYKAIGTVTKKGSNVIKYMFSKSSDPFPYFVDTVKIVNTSGKTTAANGDKISLALETRTINGAKVDSMIDNSPPKGTPRLVVWSSNNLKGALVVGNVSAALSSGSSATVSIEAIQPTIITAQWEGERVEDLKPTYNIGAVFADLNYTAVLATNSDCEGDSGTETINGTFRSLDPNKPIYNIDARNTSFTETIPTVGSKTLIFPEEGGNTTDSYVYKIDFDGFDGSGTYQFVRVTTDPETGEVSRFVCNGTYTFKGTFLK